MAKNNDDQSKKLIVLSFDAFINTDKLEDTLKYQSNIVDTPEIMQEIKKSKYEYLLSLVQAAEDDVTKKDIKVDINSLIKQGYEVAIISSNAQDQSQIISEFKDDLIKSELKKQSIEINKVRIINTDSIGNGLKEISDNNKETKLYFANRGKEAGYIAHNNNFENASVSKNLKSLNTILDKHKSIISKEQYYNSDEKSSSLKRALNKIRRSVGSATNRVGEVIGKENIIGKNVSKLGKAVKGKDKAR